MLEQEIEWLVDQDLTDYETAVNFMENRVEKIILNQSSGLIWMTQHPPIYTAGVSAKSSELLNNNISVYKTNRGGKHTYHGPGIRIIYVMLNLKKVFYPQNPDIAKFIIMLENWIINSLSKIGIKGLIRKGRVGIWVECSDQQEKKVAAIGIKIKKWVSYHGIAININPDLENFKGIIPCGIREFGTTSLKDLGVEISYSKFDKIIQEEFYKIFLGTVANLNS